MAPETTPQRLALLEWRMIQVETRLGGQTKALWAVALVFLAATIAFLFNLAANALNS